MSGNTTPFDSDISFLRYYLDNSPPSNNNKNGASKAPNIITLLLHDTLRSFGSINHDEAKREQQEWSTYVQFAREKRLGVHTDMALAVYLRQRTAPPELADTRWPVVSAATIERIGFRIRAAAAANVAASIRHELDITGDTAAAEAAVRRLNKIVDDVNGETIFGRWPRRVPNFVDKQYDDAKRDTAAASGMTTISAYAAKKVWQAASNVIRSTGSNIMTRAAATVAILQCACGARGKAATLMAYHQLQDAPGGAIAWFVGRMAPASADAALRHTYTQHDGWAHHRDKVAEAVGASVSDKDQPRVLLDQAPDGCLSPAAALRIFRAAAAGVAVPNGAEQLVFASACQRPSIDKQFVDAIAEKVSMIVRHACADIETNPSAKALRKMVRTTARKGQDTGELNQLDVRIAVGWNVESNAHDRHYLQDDWTTLARVATYVLRAIDSAKQPPRPEERPVVRHVGTWSPPESAVQKASVDVVEDDGTSEVSIRLRDEARNEPNQQPIATRRAGATERPPPRGDHDDYTPFSTLDVRKYKPRAIRRRSNSDPPSPSRSTKSATVPQPRQ